MQNRNQRIKPDPCGNSLIKKTQTLLLGILKFTSIKLLLSRELLAVMFSIYNALAYMGHQQLHQYNLLGHYEALLTLHQFFLSVI